MTNYVKIDRSLLSEIQNKPQKQHFVREIIEFCHNNNIKALAEGIESSEELRTVIHLGADLIQGFYTGRPEPEFVGRIDDKIINEIKNYYQERTDGKAKQIYSAGKTNRVSLQTLAREEYTDIVIGQEGMVYNDISIIGTPSIKTEIHMRIEAGYTGRVTLENVYFSNIKNRPCIELGENSDVVLVLEGSNELMNTGILVPESARLTIEGPGDMRIDLNNQEYFGIGNGITSRHGKLNLLQGGPITIIGKGTTGIGIGSGLGGTINITGGEFHIVNNGDVGVGIGSFKADSDINITNCSIELDISLNKGVGIGSLEKNSSVRVSRTSVRFSGDGIEIVGIGTLMGDSCYVNIFNALVELNIGADTSTCMGAINGETEIEIGTASIRIDGAGEKAIAVGGYNENTKVSLSSVDTRVNLHNSFGKDILAPDEAISIVNGRYRVSVNDKEIERQLVYKFNK